MNGLLVNGKRFEIPNVTVVGPSLEVGFHLTSEDGCPRTRWPQQWILHKTIADDPERMLPGAGSSIHVGGAEDTAEMWAKDGKHSGTQLITGHNGQLLQLADVATVEGYHATVSNPYSVGHETKEMRGGTFYEAAAKTTVETTLVGTRALGIQWQCPRGYSGKPLRRMLDGGKSCVGIFGHRDNTTSRNRWDPGDILFGMLRNRGVMMFDFDAGEDLVFWKDVQNDLNRRGHKLFVDGIPGAKTTQALRDEGYIDGIFALGKAA